MMRSLPSSISDSLLAVYFSGAGVVPKGKRRQMKASFPTIVMHVDTICAFAWTRRYAASRYILPIRMRFEGPFDAHG